MRLPGSSTLGLGGAMLVAAGAITIAGQLGGPRSPMRPREPIQAILDAFGAHDVVALGEVHRNEQMHRFRLSLIRDPRFPVVVNDIVVEFGNARYQEVMDRFIRGEDVPADALRRAWQDTSMTNGPWDAPMYEEFFRAVRDVNVGLPREHRLRVVLGDPPATAGARGTAEDRDVYRSEWLKQRDTYAEDVIRREVLVRNHRALLLWGDAHVVRNLGFTLSGRLENLEGIRVYAISGNATADLQRLQADVASWPLPSLVETHGTTLGAVNQTIYPQFGEPVHPGEPPLLEDRFDAVLYLGPPSSMTTSR